MSERQHRLTDENFEQTTGKTVAFDHPDLLRGRLCCVLLILPLKRLSLNTLKILIRRWSKSYRRPLRHLARGKRPLWSNALLFWTNSLSSFEPAVSGMRGAWLRKWVSLLSRHALKSKSALGRAIILQNMGRRFCNLRRLRARRRKVMCSLSRWGQFLRLCRGTFRSGSFFVLQRRT